MEQRATNLSNWKAHKGIAEDPAGPCGSPSAGLTRVSRCKNKPVSGPAMLMTSLTPARSRTAFPGLPSETVPVGTDGPAHMVSFRKGKVLPKLSGCSDA